MQDILDRNTSGNKEKTVIMIHEKNSMKTLAHTLNLVKTRSLCLQPTRGLKVVEVKETQRQNSVKLQMFNGPKNAYAQDVQVLVAHEE